MMRNIANFVLFQCAWLLTILAAAGGRPYLGLLFTLLWMGVHLLWFAEDKKTECLLLGAAALTGYVLESLLLVSAVVSYPSQAMFGAPVPLWMVALWVNLAATIHYSLSWLKTHYLGSAALAMLAAPVAYGSGAKLGAINLSGTMALVIIALIWSLAMPFLFWVASVLEKEKRTSKPLSSTCIE